jgi:FkbH-like protein
VSGAPPPQLDYLALAKAAKRLDRSRCSQKVRLAVLGDCATQHLTAILPVLSARASIDVALFEAEYDSIELQAFDAASDLYAFMPDAIVLLNSTGKLRKKYYAFGADKADFAAHVVRKVTTVWDAIGRQTKATVVQSTFVLPIERLYGNFDNKVDGSLYACAQRINAELVREARSRSAVLINDLDYLASYVGKHGWLDETLWTVGKGLCALDHLPRVAQNIVDIVSATRGGGIKCVVLDLDNTVWGGTVGDDGVEGIRIGALGDGEAFEAFQSYLRELRRRGLLLAVCSKNDRQTALRPFREHPDMVLREEDIAVFVANWDNKVDNLRAVQATLNIGFDSMVFLDDNPFERNLVRQFLPEVTVPELPEDPANYVSCLSELNLFETSSTSSLDVERTARYHDQAQRDSARLECASLDGYLQSLEMKATLARFDAFHLPRIAQLVQRSNQFNLTTRRYSATECESFMRDADGSFPFWISLADKFGDNGLILVAICRLVNDALDIDSFLMSCRVLQRGVEQLAMNTIVDVARRHGLRRVTGRYVPTARNGMVKDFYRQFGFEAVAHRPDGEAEFAIAVSDYVPKPVLIDLVEPSPSEAGVNA